MIFFRASSISNAMEIIRNIFTINLTKFFEQSLVFVELYIYTNMYQISVLIVSMIILFIVGIISRKTDIIEDILKEKVFIRWTILLFLIFAILIFGHYGPAYDATAFIYRQF